MLQQPLVIRVTRNKINRITAAVINIGRTSTNVVTKETPIIIPTANKIKTAKKPSAKS